jgi:hypothetical protein
LHLRLARQKYQSQYWFQEVSDGSSSLQYKKILKAQGEGESFCPPNCTVKLPFQPIKGVKGDPANLSLANELAALTKETKLPLGKLYLRGLQINNNARKSKFLTILCATMAHTAEMSLA